MTANVRRVSAEKNITAERLKNITGVCINKKNLINS